MLPASAAGAAAGDTAAGLAVSDSSVDTTLSAALPLSAAAVLPLLLTSAVSALMAVVDAATSAGCTPTRSHQDAAPAVLALGINNVNTARGMA